MYLMREIGTRGVYGNPCCPTSWSFWLEGTSWYWTGFEHFPLPPHGGNGAGRPRPGFRLAGLSLAHHRVYLSIITQAMTYALMLAFFRNEMGFGGNNGLTDSRSAGFRSARSRNQSGALRGDGDRPWFGLLICRVVVASKLGRVMMPCAMPKVACASSAIRLPRQTVRLYPIGALAGVPEHSMFPRSASSIRRVLTANSIEIAIWSRSAGGHPGRRHLRRSGLNAAKPG